jgi:hypothetical protein
MALTNKDQQPLSTQGDAAEKEEQLGGTTNLGLDQLKKEGDPAEDRPDTQENNESPTASAGNDEGNGGQ